VIYVPPSEAAAAAGVQPGTLRLWVKRGHISPPVDGCYNLAEIEAYSALRDATQFGRALRSRTRRGESRRVACPPPDCL
jgi:predicted site-specific integrase-resolvase